jgi:hypothetical protein
MRARRSLVALAAIPLLAAAFPLAPRVVRGADWPPSTEPTEVVRAFVGFEVLVPDSVASDTGKTRTFVARSLVTADSALRATGFAAVQYRAVWTRRASQRLQRVNNAARGDGTYVAGPP